MLSESQQKRTFNIIIATQCLGMLSASLFQNGFFLNYFTKLGISSAATAFLFALPALLGAFLILPFAFIADRKGKQKLALIGQIMMVGSMLIMMGAGQGHATLAIFIVAGAILLFALGGSLQSSCWFALLSPIVPEKIRGRFFGRLRVSFQTATILFSILITRTLARTDTMLTFQLIIGVVLVAHILRYFTYARIPELEKEQNLTGGWLSFATSLKSVFQVQGFASFNCYVFLITLFTAGVPIIFALMQKDVFLFSPSQITLMGTLFLAGSVLGNLFGGRLVDRFGTRFVFLVTQLSVALVIFGMLTRHWMPWTLTIHIGLIVFLFNMILAVQGIAITSEMLALIPASNKSLSTAVCVSLFNLGVAVSGMFVARSISWDLLAAEWKIGGFSFTAYDSLLMLFAIMILVMLATIGLVPKIVKKVQLMPGSGYPRI